MKTKILLITLFFLLTLFTLSAYADEIGYAAPVLYLKGNQTGIINCSGDELLIDHEEGSNHAVIICRTWLTPK